VPETKIPTFASDGRRLRAYSLQAIERLLSLSLVVVRHNRRGQIVCAHFRPQDGSNPLRATANMGQRYYYLEHVGDRRVYAHTPLISRQDLEELKDTASTPEELDRYVRNIFRAVPLSCMERCPRCGEPLNDEMGHMCPRKHPAKVVNIESYRRRARKTNALAGQRQRSYRPSALAPQPEPASEACGVAPPLQRPRQAA
jgi:hypothetical protein